MPKERRASFNTYARPSLVAQVKAECEEEGLPLTDALDQALTAWVEARQAARAEAERRQARQEAARKAAETRKARQAQ